MNGMLDDLQALVADGLKNRTLTTCSRWANRRRIMGGDFPGPYSDKYHPWVQEMHDSWAPFNWAMKGAQLGVTEVAINRALYTIDKLKRDVMYVLPTTKNASKFSKGRFGPALALSPYLKGIFTDINSVDLKQAGTNCLYISGSRGDSNLKSVPVSELILDEVDEMDQKAIWLALTRLDGHIEKHVWGISTPTVHNHGIHKLFKTSTQEQFVFQCPGCSHRIFLTWPDNVEIIGESVTDPRCLESFLKCHLCGNAGTGRETQLAERGRMGGDESQWKPQSSGFPNLTALQLHQVAWRIGCLLLPWLRRRTGQQGVPQLAAWLALRQRWRKSPTR